MHRMPRTLAVRPPDADNACAALPCPPARATCVQVEAVSLAAFYEQRLQEGAKAVFHIEAFVAKFMSMFKNWAVANL